MVLQVSPAKPADVTQIATIHLSAFDSNPLLHVQFPTPASLKALHSILCNDMLRTIEAGEESGSTVLVVRDTEEADGQIVSFAKWDLPSRRKDAEIHPGASWPEECRTEFLDGYHEEASKAKERVLGGRECYLDLVQRNPDLTFVGTEPKSQGRGACTLLTQWGVSRAREERVPVYLESTLNAVALYRHLGFQIVDGLSLKIPGTTEDGAARVYQELCMLKTWEDGDEDENADGLDYWDSSLNISSLQEDYRAGMRPHHVVQAIYDRVHIYKDQQPSLWIYLRPIADVMKDANRLWTQSQDKTKDQPLWCIPFSVKDSIDVTGIPTTNGCPALSFTPSTSATVFQKCIDAGGLFIGKTNMEQLATGLTGCRSAYGTLHSTFSKEHVVGGSSSGSAVSVGAGLVSFSIGSDTAGSIRVPALFNGVVGFKPTKGTVSAKGVAPACIHQDCVSFLASTAEDAEMVWRVSKGYDRDDHFARRLMSADISGDGVTNQSVLNTADLLQKSQPLEAILTVPPKSVLDACSVEYRDRFSRVIQYLERRYSVQSKVLDWSPFAVANDLLYEGTFVLERLTTQPDGWFETNKDVLHPVTRRVFESALARKSTAVDVFRDLHKQAECKRTVENILTDIAPHTGTEEKLVVIIVPTTPFHPTIKQVERDPIGINSKLGTFSHFANVLDLTAIAVPCGTYEIDDGIESGGKTTLPFGVTILAGCGLDEKLLMLARDLEEDLRDIGDEEG